MALRSTGSGSGKRRGSRIGTSSSPLSNPETPIYELAAGFQHYMYLPDPSLLYVTLGAMAGNMMLGTPPWLFLVGESGSGKTMMLKSLQKLEGVRTVSSISGESGLLSGSGKRDRAKNATGGLLRELGDNGCLAFMDFTTVLSKSEESAKELMGVLRELFDKTWSRDVGSDGGQHLAHEGRVCFIAGVTHTIDRHADVSAEMGQRSLFYRLPPTDGFHESMCALDIVDDDETMDVMRGLVGSLFDGLGLSLRDLNTRRHLEIEEKNRVTGLAQLGVMLRNHVPRHWRTREIEDIPSAEMPARMAKQLSQVYVGMEVIGVSERDRWRILSKLVMDSMPRLRKRALEVVAGGRAANNGIKVSAAVVARETRVSHTTATRVLEDLEVLGVVERNKKQWLQSQASMDKEYTGGWDLTEWSMEKLKQVKEEGVAGE